MNKLLATSQNLDIEISGDIFNREATLADLARYRAWRKETSRTLAALEEEINAYDDREMNDVGSSSESDSDSGSSSSSSGSNSGEESSSKQ